MDVNYSIRVSPTGRSRCSEIADSAFPTPVSTCISGNNVIAI